MKTIFSSMSFTVMDLGLFS